MPFALAQSLYSYWMTNIGRDEEQCKTHYGMCFGDKPLKQLRGIKRNAKTIMIPSNTWSCPNCGRNAGAGCVGPYTAQ
jgi:hypothetical protein